MRIAFLLALLALSVFYTALAFIDHEFLSARGRIAPGFFPQIIGTLLTVFLIFATTEAVKKNRNESVAGSNIMVSGGISLMVGLLILTSHYLGALPGMLIFMLLALFTLNRGRYVTNLALGILLPVGLYSLFRFTLNAALPPGMLGLPL